MGWILITAFVLLCVLAIYTIFGIRRLQKPTAGTAIDRSKRPNRALVVIDLQDDFLRPGVKPDWNRTAADDKLAATDAAMRTALQDGVAVATIRQVFEGWYPNLLVRLFGQGRGANNSPGLHLDTRLNAQADVDFTKPGVDAFSSPAFEKWLADNAIGDLEIAGLDGCYCVQATAHGALNRGYGVSLRDDLIMTKFPDRWESVRYDLLARGAAGIRPSPV